MYITEDGVLSHREDMSGHSVLLTPHPPVYKYAHIVLDFFKTFFVNYCTGAIKSLFHINKSSFISGSVGVRVDEKKDQNTLIFQLLTLFNGKNSKGKKNTTKS